MVESPSNLPMWGVNTQLSAPNSNTACTMSRYNIPNAWLSAPSQPSILNRQAQLCRTLCIFLMTSVHSSYVAVRIRLSYQRDITIFRVYNYVLEVVSFPARASSSERICFFRSNSLVHRSVVWWQLFSASQGTNMTQAGQQGWGRLTSFIITIVSRTKDAL